MQLRTLSFTLMAFLPAATLAACSSTSTSTKGQLITCTVDPGTGAVGRCEPGDGGGSGSGANTCQDIDEDGDGDPHDDADDRSHVASADGHDGDSEDRDCDEHAGEDGMEDGLPYDVRPQLGATTRPIIDAFTARGSQPAAIVSVKMDSGTWRLAELQAGP